MPNSFFNYLVSINTSMLISLYHKPQDVTSYFNFIPLFCGHYYWYYDYHNQKTRVINRFAQTLSNIHIIALIFTRFLYFSQLMVNYFHFNTSYLYYPTIVLSSSKELFFAQNKRFIISNKTDFRS
jgi:hypothetical protein